MAMKHVLIIGLTGRMGGVETFIKNVVLASDRNEVQFDLLVHDGSTVAVYEDQIETFYNDDERRHVHHVTPFKRNPLASLCEMWKLRDCLGFEFDWVHLNTGSPAEVIYAIPFVLGPKTGLISHSHIGSGANTLAQRAGRALLNQLSSYELACSDRAAEWLFGAERGRDALMVRNGIDTSAFKYDQHSRVRVRAELGVGDAMLVGHIGRFHEMKNHKMILSVFKEYLGLVPKAQLCLVGVGETMDETEALVSNLSLTGRVHFLGARNDTAALYSAFDCFLMPSLYEGLPVVLVEAQTSGLPVVMSDTISSDSIINQELCTVVELEESDEEWAEHLPQVPLNERSNCCEVVADAGFDIRIVSKNLERLYRGDPSGFARVGGTR